MDNNWVIAGKPDGAIPIANKLYEIRDRRKGTFVGRIIGVSGGYADVEVVSGKIRWASVENNLFNKEPKVVSIRAGLVYLIELSDTN